MPYTAQLSTGSANGSCFNRELGNGSKLSFFMGTGIEQIKQKSHNLSLIKALIQCKGSPFLSAQILLHAL